MNSFEKAINALFVFVPIAFIVALLGVSPAVVFVCSALAIVPLSKLLGEATEELTTYVGPALGGLLNATLGNAPELIIAIFALRAGLVDVVKASLTGSILSNLLFVLGMAIMFGGFKHKHQKFNATAAKASGSTLLLAVSALIIPALLVLTSGSGAHVSVEVLSLIVSVLLIIAYGSSLLFSLWTHQHLYLRDAAEYIPHWSKAKSIWMLLVAGAGIAFISQILVGTIEPVVLQFGWTDMFVGIIVLAIIGNVAEHASAVKVAIKNNMDLAFQISIGSATQIALFVIPILVLVSYFFAHPMNLIFTTFELATLILAVLIVNTIVEDGESNWFEGLLLLIAYAVIATAFYLYP